MGNPPPLSVDPEQLRLAGGELLASAGQLPAAPAPFTPPIGKDPLSAAISAQIPAIEEPVAAQLPAVQVQATKTANNVVGAAEAYQATDQELGGQISQEMQNPSADGAIGSGGAAGLGAGAGSMDQMMSMPMQMASQLGQAPMQAMGAVTAVPQGAMQGVQQVGQQVQQMAGQFGGGSSPVGETREEQLPEHDGAAAGHPGAERAPEVKEQGDDSEKDSEDGTSGRHRRAESDPAADV